MRYAHKHKGSVLPEYVLPMVLLAMVTVATLPAGAQLQTFMNQAISRATGGNVTNKALLVDLGQQQQASISLINSGNNGSGGLTFTLPNGATVTLGNYAGSPAQLVETMGIAGTTISMASSIQQLAQQLRDNASLTESQYDTLIRLSNRGHDIAMVQGQLESLIQANGGNLIGLKNHAFLLNGQTTTVEKAYSAIGNDNMVAERMDSIDNVINVTDINDPDNPFTNAFLKTYQEALTDGSLNDPAIKQVIDELALNILMSGETIEHAAHNNHTDINQTLTSNFTHYQSSGICDQGNGNSNGISCKQK